MAWHRGSDGATPLDRFNRTFPALFMLNMLFIVALLLLWDGALSSIWRNQWVGLVLIVLFQLGYAALWLLSYGVLILCTLARRERVYSDTGLRVGVIAVMCFCTLCWLSMALDQLGGWDGFTAALRRLPPISFT